MSGPLNSDKLATPDLGISPEARSSEPAENQNRWGGWASSKPLGRLCQKVEFSTVGSPSLPAQAPAHAGCQAG